MAGRPYDRERDRKSLHRIIHESGWVKDDEKEYAKIDFAIDDSRVRVADLSGEAECAVSMMDGVFRHGEIDLPYAIVSSVNTGRIGRRRGLASSLLAECLADDAERGAVVAGLGIFDQGFYDRLGFGSGTYEKWIAFDPAALIDFACEDTPVRLDETDYARVHACRLSRLRRHGSVNVIPEGLTRADMALSDNGFGLGFERDGELTSSIWFAADDLESGPYTLWWAAWRTWEDIPGLLAVVKSLSDQVQIVSMREPAYLQMQDYLIHPLRSQSMSRSSKFEQRARAICYHQHRILDLERAVSSVSIAHEPVRFSVTIEDPITSFLPGSSPYSGCGGTYTVEFGPDSTCRKGGEGSLPHLECSIGAFTRLWAGVLSARALALSDDFAGPPELLDALDRSLRFPRPSPDWDF